MSPTQCPPRSELKNFLAGRLSEEDSAVFESHLGECENCGQTAAELELEPETFVDLLRTDSKSDLPDGEDSFNEQESFADVVALVNRLQPHESSMAVEEKVTLGSVGSYELLQPLGRGGMGTVMLARHRDLGKQVAIKLLPALSAQRPEVVARFRREIRAAGKLDHAAIVRATDAGEAEGVHFLVMDAIDGLDMSKVVRAVGRLGIADACEVVRQASLGLSYAHGEGIVHRDVKPSNLMLDNSGKMKILDFGLAQIGLWEEGSAELTTVGQLMGTLDYMAPEQAERCGAVDYRADLYSLGATLFRLLAGRPPLAASPNLPPLEKLRLLSSHSPPRIDTLREDVPSELSELVSELLARDPLARPPSAAHVAERLLDHCQTANLELLLADARQKAESKSAETGSARSASRIGEMQVAASAKSDGKDGGRSNSFSGRVSTYLLTAMMIAMAAFGVLFVLETTKGQLVIESEAENVQVKLVKDGKPVDELQIHQGAQTTRLRGGDYEILIDEGSDSVAVSIDKFTIKRGETIVATIRTKLADSSSGHVASAGKEKALTEPVYSGRTLSEWLRQLQFEKEEGKTDQAVRSLYYLASRDNADTVLPVISQFIVNLRPEGRLHDRLLSRAMGIVRVSSPDGTSMSLVRILEKCEPATIRQILNSSEWTTRFSFIDRDEIEPLLAWCDKQLRLATDREELQSIAGFLRLLLHQRPSDSPQVSEVCRASILDHLSSYKQLDELNFWLRQPESSDSSPHQAHEFPWSPELRDEILTRAFRVMSDIDADPELFVSAAMVATSTVPHGGHITQDQRKQLLKALSVRLDTISHSFSKDHLAQAPTSMEGCAGPNLGHAFNWAHRRTYDSERMAVSEPIVLLNFIQAFRLRSKLQSELQEMRTASSVALETSSEANLELFHGINGYWSSITQDLSLSGKLSPTLGLFQFLQVRRLLGEDVVQLARELAQMSPQPEAIIQPGDTLAIYIDRIMPIVEPGFPPEIPVVQAGSKPPVWGVPVTVDAKGRIVLLHIDQLDVHGLTPDAIRAKIRKTYIDKKILREDEQRKVTISVSLLLHAGEQLEVRNITGGPQLQPSSK